jgi:citrate lyase subunit gamma (acyl carrier protein)
MIKPIKKAQAGTLESSDILIMIAQGDYGSGIQIELVSPTMQQYGDQIKGVIEKTLVSRGVTDVIVHATDKGAWDCTIEARVNSVVSRALG